MAFRPFACRHCGKSFPHRPGADLHCSDACEKAYASAHTSARQQLLDAGFMPTATPNVLVQDGAAVTIEQVIHEGLESALRAHAVAVSSIA
jgi:hypothetical protein